MATRLYLPSSGAGAVTVSPRADWERSILAATTRPMPVGTKTNTALTDVADLHGGSNTAQCRWMSFVSDTLDVAQTISGTFSLVVRGLEASLSEDAHIAYMLRVMSQDGATERALLASSMAAATELATTAQTRIISAAAITSYAAAAGDRICLEFGTHAVTPANAANITWRFGDPTGTADFALTSGLTTDLVPWGEISVNLTFGTPVAPAGGGVMIRGAIGF